jgi:hypothetical protein
LKSLNEFKRNKRQVNNRTFCYAAVIFAVYHHQAEVKSMVTPPPFDLGMKASAKPGLP